MTTNVLIVDNNAHIYLDILKPDFPEVNFMSAADGDAAKPLLGDAEALISIARWLDAECLEMAGNLKWIQCTITGTDHLTDVLAGREDIILTSGRGIHGRQMSEITILHMLALSRQVKTLVRNQDNHVFDRFLPHVLDQRVVGIVGIGAIGEALAKLCKAFGMTVYGISNTPREVEGIDKFFTRDQLAEAAAQVDFLVVLVPLSAETENLIDADVLDAMNSDGYLINVARGGVVDEDALIAALQQGKIAGAGLDVFKVAPLPDDSPLWDMENVFMTPFVGGRSDIYERNAATIVVAPNLRQYVDGAPDKMNNIVKR